MATTPEGRVKQQVRKLLVLFKAYSHMPVQNGMGEPTLDFTGCHRGFFYAVECKAPGKKPTPRQLVTIRRMEKAGAAVFVVSNESSLRALAEWLKNPANAMARELERLQRLAAAQKDRFGQHLEAWRANNRWHGARVEQLESQVRTLGATPVPPLEGACRTGDTY